MVMWFEEFAQNQEFVTPARTITEADVISFAAWTGDYNPIHTDAEFAATTRFGERIGHGVHGIALCLGLMSRTGIFEGSAVALLGIQDWRFLSPMFIGDTVQCRISITHVRLTSRGNVGIVGREFRLVNQLDTDLQRGQMDVMVACRPATDENPASGAAPQTPGA